jgi:Ran GTPase-activating protein (RanGAP) involved in mRNA processing and transport
MKMSRPLTHLDGILEQLRRNTSLLRDLCLTGFGITDSEMFTLATALATNTTLRSIDLSFNSIGTDGFRQLIQALATNTTLESIDLSFNRIADDGFDEVVQQLASSKMPRHVNLRCNALSAKKQRWFRIAQAAAPPISVM